MHIEKMSKSQLPSQRHMHNALNKHPHYYIRTTAGIRAAASCSGLGVMHRFSNKNIRTAAGIHLPRWDRRAPPVRISPFLWGIHVLSGIGGFWHKALVVGSGSLWWRPLTSRP